MKGMHAETGRAVAGLDHLHQSVGKILTTPLAARVQRRPFGAAIADLIDAPANGATRVRLYAAVATALMRWEPRLRLARVSLSTELDAVGGGGNAGVQVIDIEGSTTETGESVTTRVRLSRGLVPGVLDRDLDGPNVSGVSGVSGASRPPSGSLSPSEAS